MEQPRTHPPKPALAAGRALAVALAAAVALGPAKGESGSVPRPAIEIEQPGHCIEPADQMRRDHPDLLRHQRDLTVHEGVRGARVSLRTCVQCHASRTGGSVIGAPRGFCRSCHEFAGIRLDCFECHASRPAEASAAAVKTESRP